MPETLIAKNLVVGGYLRKLGQTKILKLINKLKWQGQMQR
jgi:hypothetical protein